MATICTKCGKFHESFRQSKNCELRNRKQEEKEVVDLLSQSNLFLHANGHSWHFLSQR